jgi:biopolymer transport protein ExbD
MAIKRKTRLAAEVATASMNDIMFFLLLFFLIVSTVANPSVIKVFLPKASPNETLSKQPITLTINADKDYFLNDNPISAEALEGELQAAVVGLDQPTIVLRADKSLTIQDLVDVMDIGIRLKVRMVLSTTQQ